MATPAAETQEALLNAIKKHTEQVETASLSSLGKAQSLQALALAFRYTAGGNQPGQVVVEK